MLERVGVIVFSLVMVLGSLGASVWVLVSGQASTMDGLMLLAVAGVLALVFAVCLWNLTRGSLSGPGAKQSSQ